ncbi:hypothetical protein EMIHUDRAFT_79465 [Emiliania huxleyi CCMP1516]|uniref:Glycosyl transferase CAP10 domain-containing protein n=2 Tax=Emiliania huxleyi TaxID=2903 RepID=A0A0D3KHC8_EMIH1|nr:hypothetical protein EMIHUDRAFT_79465 [Emiliania huxleyi CCMP1516]EOD35163.1 hypothetical protein EMIHUDRAFT_79465 [Emiliania huxleyi CCMP1516]|eukprot:XP_005787592.1 hypothetical protein EMIHUDRAFT_79465 [Emiliania huxleyi CCMP1516]
MRVSRGGSGKEEPMRRTHTCTCMSAVALLLVAAAATTAAPAKAPVGDGGGGTNTSARRFPKFGLRASAAAPADACAPAGAPRCVDGASDKLQLCLQRANRSIWEGVLSNQRGNPTERPEWDGIDWTPVGKAGRFKTRHDVTERFPVGMRSYAEVIRWQMAPYANITSQMVDAAWSVAKQKTSARVTIRAGGMRVLNSGSDIGRRAQVLEILREVHRDSPLPDADLIILFSDLAPEQEWAPVQSGSELRRAPIFMASRRSEDSRILLLPDHTFPEFWDLIERNEHFLLSAEKDFSQRIPKMHFVGTRNTYRNSAWCLGAATANGSMMTGLLTEAIGFRGGVEKCDLPTWPERQGRSDACHYQYLLSPGGGTWPSYSNRFKNLFACGSVPVVTNTDWYEFFYPLLRPHHDFVPAENALGSLSRYVFPTAECLRQSPLIAKNIAANARQFVKQHLSKRAVKQYVRDLLVAYSKRMSIPRRGPNRVTKGVQ